MNSMRAPELDMRRDQIMSILTYMYIYFFFFNDTATTEIYTLSLHDALPISPFPSEDTTPPVTKIYFGAIRVARVLTPGLSALHRSDVGTIMAGTRNSVKSNTLFPQNDFSSLAPRTVRQHGTFPVQN